jgi:hypothetical protein
VIERIASRAGIPEPAALIDIVNAIKAMPYGRTKPRTADACVSQWRGTCSTKHAVLLAALRERWPETDPRLMHRVYTLNHADAAARYGPDVAATIPDGGFIDVHCYLVITCQGRATILDATLPDGATWDGTTSMQMACGDGDDYAAGENPGADKRALEEQWCDETLREPFIAAVAAHFDVPAQTAQRRQSLAGLARRH